MNHENVHANDIECVTIVPDNAEEVRLMTAGRTIRRGSGEACGGSVGGC